MKAKTVVSKTGRRGGFTLIELLAVIAIIAHSMRPGVAPR
jgi:prepilin-type N-terminal cleavage/methylation domain-containing protein